MGWNHPNSASSCAECKDISQASQGHEQARHGEREKEIWGSISLSSCKISGETWHLDTFWKDFTCQSSLVFNRQTLEFGMLVWVVDFLLPRLPHKNEDVSRHWWDCSEYDHCPSFFIYVNGFFWNAVNPGNTHFNWHPKWALELHKSTNRWPNLSLQKHGSETKKIATDGTVATKPDLDIEGETTTRVLALFDWFRVKICNNPCFNQPFPLL